MTERLINTTELRELIQDAMSVRDERVNGQFNVIDCKLDGITQRLDKLNGTVARHEKIINERTVMVADYLDHAKGQRMWRNAYGRLRINSYPQRASRNG